MADEILNSSDDEPLMAEDRRISFDFESGTGEAEEDSDTPAPPVDTPPVDALVDSILGGLPQVDEAAAHLDKATNGFQDCQGHGEPKAVEKILKQPNGRLSMSIEPEAVEQPYTQPNGRLSVSIEPANTLEIVLRPLPQHLRHEYKRVKTSDFVATVHERVPDSLPGEEWFTIQYDDGRIDQVSSLFFGNSFNMYIKKTPSLST
jgi:hypothetical protein